MGALESAGKRQESTAFLHRSLFDVAVRFSVSCSAAQGKNDIRAAEKRILQCNFFSSEKTKDTVRVSIQEYLFTGSSKVTSCGFWQKRVRLSDLLDRVSQHSRNLP